MAIQETKFSISIEKLEIKFEGTQELGQQIHQGVTQAIGGLMSAPTRLLAARDEPARVVDGTTVIDATQAPVNGHISPVGADEKAKHPRQRRAKSGPSITNLLQDLKQEGYFSQARTGAEVISNLKDNKGHNLPESAVRGGLKKMVQKADDDPGKLYRSKHEKVYVYKDTPFNGSDGSPSSPERPVS